MSTAHLILRYTHIIAGLPTLACGTLAMTFAKGSRPHRVVGNVFFGATVFAVGSTLFSYLFLRARSIPVWLAWLGIFSSVLLVVGLPSQLVGLVKGPVVDYYMWIPMFVFEVTLALWLLIKGVAAPPSRHSSLGDAAGVGAN